MNQSPDRNTNSAIMIAAFEQHIVDHYDLPGMRPHEMAVVMERLKMDPRIEDDIIEAMRMVGVKREG